MERDTYRYVLRDGRKTVQFGISNGPDDRVAEHLRNGKRFTSMTIEGPAVTKDSALDQGDGTGLGVYRETHGRRPRYNKV